MIRERERWCAKVFQNHERKRRRLNWKKKKVFPAKRPPWFPWRSDTLQLQRSGRLQIYYTHAALSSTLLLRRCPVLGSRPPVNTDGLGEHRILSTLRIKSSTLSGCVCVWRWGLSCSGGVTNHFTLLKECLHLLKHVFCATPAGHKPVL